MCRSDYTVVGPYPINGSRWNYGLHREEADFLNSENTKMIALSSLVIGIIACLAGLFLILAYLQVLPNGVNAISQHAIWGKLIGGGLLSFGLLSIICGLALSCFCNNCTGPLELVQNEPERFDEKGAKWRFHSMSRRYDLAVEKTPKDNIAGRNHITNLWNGLDVFAQSYPEFRSQIPEKPF